MKCMIWAVVQRLPNKETYILDLVFVIKTLFQNHPKWFSFRIFILSQLCALDKGYDVS